MSINLCAQQSSKQFQGIISVALSFSFALVKTISFLLEWTLLVCHRKNRFNLTLSFLAKLRRSREAVRVIKHTHTHRSLAMHNGENVVCRMRSNTKESDELN